MWFLKVFSRAVNMAVILKFPTAEETRSQRQETGERQEGHEFEYLPQFV